MIAEGAIAAGCRFFAGYPITPASGIYKSMIDELPKVGDIAISSPDEISALAFCVGASQRGFKAMTATSGPGFSLMIETLQYAVMTETPVVIALVQRLGPSTGGATQGGQGDALLVGHSIAGGYTLPVFSPSNPAEAFELTTHAFNVAEEFRTPVVLLTDKEVAMTFENIDYDRLRCSEPMSRKYFASSEDRGFRNYFFENRKDVPEFSPVGGDCKVTITGSAHDMSGKLQKNSAETIEVLKHLQEKISCNTPGMIVVDEDLQEGADSVIMSYGISARTCKEAVRAMRRRGERISFLNLQTLFPLPVQEIRNACGSAKKVIFVEENMTGLYKGELAGILNGKNVVAVNDVGKMITPAAIEDAAVEQAGGTA